LSYCRRFAKDALTTSVALDIVAPVEGRTWTAICCSCLDRVEYDIADEHVYRLACASWMSFPGGCMLCPYYGCDTLVAAIRCTVAVEVQRAA
jgi:hypothetical protein